MKYLGLLFLIQSFFFIGCASKSKLNDAMLEKYRHCYHQNVKLMNACFEKNEKGENITAMQMENSAYPGQYK